MSKKDLCSLEPSKTEGNEKWPSKEGRNSALSKK